MECNIYKKVAKVILSNAYTKKVVELCLSEIDKLDYSVSVHLVGERRIRTLNMMHRGLDYATDVISFSALEGDVIGDSNDLGDIFICIDKIRKQARKYGVSEKEEFVRMLAHGILHLAGYDHKDEDQEEKMFKKQEKIVHRAKELISI